MSDTIYLLDGDKKTTALNMESYSAERELQEIIANNPSILMRESDPELFLVQRELTLPGTFVDATDLSLDHFMVDSQGVPVLVEVKQVANPEIRRKVVGQMLEYAARISFYDSTELQEMYANNNGNDAPAGTPHDFWKTVSSNLRAGRLRLVFAADAIPNTLKVIIELLDRSMADMDVYGVEIKKFTSENHTYLSTNFVLNTAKASTRQIESKSRWSDVDVESFLNQAYQDTWAFAFFKAVREHAKSLGIDGRYGNAEAYAPYRYRYKGDTVFSFNTDENGASLYFVTKKIVSMTHDSISWSEILQRLTAIDPDAKYTKEKRPVHLRTKVSYYRDVHKQEMLFGFLQDIMQYVNV